ncbi:hypothetical protein Sste5346_001974 [Sporothrix stenoceras]|uniref:Uncharacterized protein n=1 Tax=Sporothrix stenoceras TaxID=5173 RepID=A0ABR3ZM38_9PEZI
MRALGLFHHHNKNHEDTSHADSAQMAGEQTFNTQDPSVRTTNNPMHPDMRHNDNVNNVGGNKHHHLPGTGNHDNKNATNNNGAQNFYEDNYDNVPRTTGAHHMDNTMMDSNMSHNHGLSHNGVHNNSHSNNHHGMAGAGLGAAAGSAAGVAAGKHMHNNNHDGLNGHGMHHNRGGPIPGVMNNGMTGGAVDGAGVGGGMGGTGMTGATAAAMDPTTMIAEEHNNFPGTNPHSAHSALGANGQGTAFPGRV